MKKSFFYAQLEPVEGPFEPVAAAPVQPPDPHPTPQPLDLWLLQQTPPPGQRVNIIL